MPPPKNTQHISHDPPKHTKKRQVVSGRARNAFVACRPPGHHAGRNGKPMLPADTSVQARDVGCAFLGFVLFFGGGMWHGMLGWGWCVLDTHTDIRATPHPSHIHIYIHTYTHAHAQGASASSTTWRARRCTPWSAGGSRVSRSWTLICTTVSEPNEIHAWGGGDRAID